MASRKLVHDAGSLKIFEGDQEDHLVLSMTDNLIWADGKHKGKVRGKAALNFSIAAHLYEYLESYHVLTHFISTAGDSDLIVRNLNPIPVDVIVHNVATKSIAKEQGIKTGTELNGPIIEFCQHGKKADLDKLTQSADEETSPLSADDLRNVSRLASKINAIIRAFFKRRNLNLLNIELNFARYKGQIALSSTINLDNCSLREVDSKEAMGKDRLIGNLGDVENSYKALYAKIIGG